MQNTIHGLGTLGNTYWEGIVEDRNDPMMLGRVRVRIAGWHTHRTKALQNSGDFIRSEDLPWAIVPLPTTSSGMHGIGESMHGLVEGSYVFGFFRDNKDKSSPIVLGVIPGKIESVLSSEIAEPSYNTQEPTRLLTEGFCDQRTDSLKTSPRPLLEIEGKKEAASAVHYPHDKTALFQARNGSQIGETDIHKIARGKLTGTILGWRSALKFIASFAERKASPFFKIAIVKKELIETFQVTNFFYPWVKVSETESGHTSIKNDTPGHEYIAQFHRTGTFNEILPDGSTHRLVQAHESAEVKKDVTRIIGGEYSLSAGSYRIQGSNTVLTIDATGKLTISGSSNVDIFAEDSIRVESTKTIELYGATGINLTSPQTVAVSTPLLALSIGGISISTPPGVNIPVSCTVNSAITTTYTQDVNTTFLAANNQTIAAANITINSGVISMKGISNFTGTNTLIGNTEITQVGTLNGSPIISESTHVF
jgi:hypothetical protein